MTYHKGDWMNWFKKENIEIAIGIVVIAGIIILAFIWGCAPEPLTDPNAIEATISAKADADIKKITAMTELGCYIGAGACVFLVLLGVYLKSKMMMILSAFGIIAFIVEIVLLTAKIEHPRVIAVIGLGILILAVVAFVVIVIKALVQVVKGNENYLGRLVGEDEIFKTEQKKAQTPTTTKIIDLIRKKGDSK